ncbi:MAG TPA: CoA transferase [Dehalococcoidia bacterium]|jgi:crotonobetainyl-CoA:carnitine CoA-transferase CaiB-like acyl-CoA transferase|nr:CoA transferase [Dehalococcoidia bacterium]
MTTKLLDGLRIVEACEVWAGPMAGSLFGDLGADVVKIESFPRSSMTRPLRVAPGPQGQAVGGNDGPPYEQSGIHHLANRNKRNIAMDIRSEAGAEAARRLIADADVFFEGYSSGTMERLGFGWDVVKEINPNIVMISMPGWGVEGPYRGYVTLGSGLDAGVGHVSVRGYPQHDTGFVPAIFHSDATGALTVIFAALAGLRQREKSGKGCFIDMSQIEAMGWQFPGIFAEWTMNERRPQRLGNSDPHIVPHGCYRAAGDEQWVAIAAEDDAQWAALAGVIGKPEWAAGDDPRASVVGRLRAREEIDAAIGEYASQRTPAEAADAIQEAGAIAAPVTRAPETLASPQLNAREWFNTVEHRYAGTNIMGGFLWQIAEDPATWDRVCATVGEHNVEVLSALGFSADEIATMQRDGAIGDSYELPSA